MQNFFEMYKQAILISCEHASNLIPSEYQQCFDRTLSERESHEFYDLGAAEIAQHLHKELVKDYPVLLLTGEVTRLIIDLNRSLDNPLVYSWWTHNLSKQQKSEIENRYYVPFRTAAREWVNQSINSGQRVVHISVHSFTPQLNGVTRKCDIGLLFDPDRELESKAFQLWQQSILQERPNCDVKANYPYAGVDDGHTTALRQLFTEKSYLGIEVEVNQRALNSSTEIMDQAGLIARSLENTLIRITQL